MKPIQVFVAAAVLLLVSAGCSTSPARPAIPEPDSPTPPGKSSTANVPQEGAEWDELLRKLRKEYQVSEQEQEAQADEHYKLGERYYQSGDFEKAEMEAERALRLNPDHAAAHALFLEIQFVLRRNPTTPRGDEYDKFIKQAIVQHSQILAEIDEAYARGVRAYNLANYKEAGDQFRQILEYVKWMPTGVDLETRRRQAMGMLEKTKTAERKSAVEEAKSRNAFIEEERARDEIERLLEQKRELELLFGQAQLFFEKERYKLCMELCDKILYINPNLNSVSEMKMVAQRLTHMASHRDNLRDYVEEWKRTFERVEMNAVVQAAVLEFPNHEIWNQIRQRPPRGIAEMGEEISEEDQKVLDILRNTRITLDQPDQTLTSVVDYIRDYTGLNIHIDGKLIEDPDSEMISINVKDIPLKGALDLMLQQIDCAHYVEDGVIIITKTEGLKANIKLELYDVQDLTYGLQDFPGVDISLATDSLGVDAMEEEGELQQFTGDDLAELIENNIHKEAWDDAEGQSIIHNNGLLIVRNTIEVHKAVRKFLSNLRASTGILVSVECRFLTVEDSFLQKIGMDFRDADFLATGQANPRAVGILDLDDIVPNTETPAFPTQLQPEFVSPGGGLSATSPGLTGQFGDSIQRNLGLRVQQIMTNDFLVQQFYNNVLPATGGATLQYTLMDDISLEMILRAVSKTQRAHMLTAPKLTLFNTQRGNIRISNQFAYIRDYDIQIATAAVAPDPIPDVVSDGITLDVRPIVSSDRRYVTIELRPTVASLFPPPPAVFSININLAVPGNPVTPALPVTIETPILNIQRLRTTVVVPDRGTLLIGGLTIFFEENAESSIPIWRNIPILGNLGSEKVKGAQKRQLLIILKARIIIPDEEERRKFD